MTPDQFKTIRQHAGLSVNALADIIDVHPRTVRRFEDGSAPVSGPVAKLMKLIYNGVL